MIRNTVLPVAWLWVACVIIGAALAGSSKADPTDPATGFAITNASTVREALDRDPSPRGVALVLDAVASTGLTDFQAGEAVALSVIYHCPQFRPLLKQFVAQYGPQQKGVSA